MEADAGECRPHASVERPIVALGLCTKPCPAAGEHGGRPGRDHGTSKPCFREQLRIVVVITRHEHAGAAAA